MAYKDRRTAVHYSARYGCCNNFLKKARYQEMSTKITTEITA